MIYPVFVEGQCKECYDILTEKWILLKQHFQSKACSRLEPEGTPSLWSRVMARRCGGLPHLMTSSLSHPIRVLVFPSPLRVSWQLMKLPLWSTIKKVRVKWMIFHPHRSYAWRILSVFHLCWVEWEFRDGLCETIFWGGVRTYVFLWTEMGNCFCFSLSQQKNPQKWKSPHKYILYLNKTNLVLVLHCRRRGVGLVPVSSSVRVLYVVIEHHCVGCRVTQGTIDLSHHASGRANRERHRYKSNISPSLLTPHRSLPPSLLRAARIGTQHIPTCQPTTDNGVTIRGIL